MTGPSDEIGVAGLRDDPDMVYIVTIGAGVSERYAEIMADRFDEMFVKANFVVLSEDSLNIKTDEEVELWQVDKDRLKEAYKLLKAKEEKDDDTE